MSKLRPHRPPTRRSGWPFGRRGNRRVRLTRAAPELKLEWKKLVRPLVFVVVTAAFGGAAFATHRYLTRSPHFAVRALRFSPTKHVTSDSLAARAGEVIGLNLFKVNLEELQRDVLAEPWIASAHARRELPSTIAVDVVEREPACGVALGPIYLADKSGNVFKRANPDEAASLPVVTGLERDQYLADPDGAREEIHEALGVIQAWGARPPIGEAHVDPVNGVTLYVGGGVGVRLGTPGDDLPARLHRFDAVWAALESSGEKPRLIYLDNRARPDRVTVKLANPPPVPDPPLKKKAELDSEKDT